MKNEIIDLLTEYATNERLSKIIQNDLELKVARIHVNEIYTELQNILPDKYRELFDQFTIANSEKDARIEFLTYQQGLKDMYNLIMSLQNKEAEE